MHERSSLKSVSRPFASQKRVSQTTQIIVNFRHHLGNRGGVAPLAVISLTHERRSQ